MLANISLCIMKSYLFAMFIWNFTTTSLSIAEIFLFIKRWSKIAVFNIALNACVLYAYLRPPILTTAHCASVFSVIFAYTKTKCSLISREDWMLIKVLHQEKGSKKLLAEFPNDAFELIPTVFIVLETCVFSVSFKR